MRKAEIDRKFDEIVAFAEIEEFLDTPVKRYSSGMYVRLAFAVAAHLEPEILIVDEVLAVGDYAVPEEVPGQDAGRGQPATAGRSCSSATTWARWPSSAERGILLEEGSVATIGPIQDVIDALPPVGLRHRAGPGSIPARSVASPASSSPPRSSATTARPGSEFSCDEPVIIRAEASRSASRPRT